MSGGIICVLFRNCLFSLGDRRGREGERRAEGVREGEAYLNGNFCWRLVDLDGQA